MILAASDISPSRPEDILSLVLKSRRIFQILASRFFFLDFLVVTRASEHSQLWLNS